MRVDVGSHCIVKAAHSQGHISLCPESGASISGSPPTGILAPALPNIWNFVLTTSCHSSSNASRPNGPRQSPLFDPRQCNLSWWFNWSDAPCRAHAAKTLLEAPTKAGQKSGLWARNPRFIFPEFGFTLLSQSCHMVKCLQLPYCHRACATDTSRKPNEHHCQTPTLRLQSVRSIREANFFLVYGIWTTWVDTTGDSLTIARESLLRTFDFAKSILQALLRDEQSHAVCHLLELHRRFAMDKRRQKHSFVSTLATVVQDEHVAGSELLDVIVLPFARQEP